MTDKEPKTLEYDAPNVTPEAQQIISEMQRFTGAGSPFMQDLTRYVVAMKLFDPNLLHFITQLSREKIEVMTRHDTLIDSLCQWGQFNEEERKEIGSIIHTMHDSYATHQISKERKSRTEIVNILKGEVIEHIRSVGEKLGGKKLG